jgi:hypothetical protein
VPPPMDGTDAGTTGPISTAPAPDAGTPPVTDAGTVMLPPPADGGTTTPPPPADGGTTANHDCDAIAVPSAATPQTFAGHWDPIEGESGNPLGSGDGTAAAMLSSNMHPVWTLVSPSNTVLGSHGEWEGSLFPQPSGFMVWSYNSATQYTVNHVADDGTVPMAGDQLHFYGSEQVVANIPAGGVVVAGQFVNPSSAVNRRHIAGFFANGLASYITDIVFDSAIFGLGADDAGRALVISDGSSSCVGCVVGQWFEPGGSAGDPFVLIRGFTAGPSTWFETAPLIGGGLAVRRRDYDAASAGQTGVTTSQWLVTVGSGSTTPAAAPSWMAADTNLGIVLGARAYALLPSGAHSGGCEVSVPVFAPTGTQCGTFSQQVATAAGGDCGPNYDVVLGEDGTVLYRMPPATETSIAAGHDTTYTLKFWPAALR